MHPNLASADSGSTAWTNARSLQPVIDRMTAAFQTEDLTKARRAYERYDSVWNGIEIYIQFMSVERYNYIEHVLQDAIEAGLGLTGSPPTPFPELIGLSKQTHKTYDEILDFQKHSPSPGKLFDDVATLRIINQGIRLARAAIDGNPGALPPVAPDPVKAQADWNSFASKYPQARALLGFRNPALLAEVDTAVTAVEASLAAGEPTAVTSGRLAALAGRYNLGTTLVTAAARNVVRVKSMFTEADKDVLTALDSIRDDVKLDPAAGAESALATFITDVKTPLSFKTGGPLTKGDTALARALTTLAAGQTPANRNAVIDQANVAEQTFVGQFWGRPALKAFLATLST